jgi:hypothetical protein
MSATTGAVTTATTTTTGEKFGRLFFENLWRMSGVQAVAFIVIGSVIAGFGPGVGASPETLGAFYAANGARILIATPILGLGVLNLLWFAQAIRTILVDNGLDGWGGAAIAASSAVGAIAFLLIATQAALAYTIAGSGNVAFAAGLSVLGWAGVVLSSFPRAMLIMAGSFGLWRAGFISNRAFGLAVSAVILGVLGGTTWLAGDIWSPDGVFSRFIWPAIGLVWVLAVSRIVARIPSSRSGF